MSYAICLLALAVGATPAAVSINKVITGVDQVAKDHTAKAINMPHGALVGKTTGRTVIIIYHGQEISVEIPPMELRTPEDRKKLEAFISEQVRNNPKLVEARKVRLEEWKEHNLKQRLVQLDELEKQQLEKVANATLEEREKKAFVAQIKKSTIYYKEKAKKRLDELVEVDR